MSRLASRLLRVCDRTECVELHTTQRVDETPGSLVRVFALLDHDLGLPTYVVHALSRTRLELYQSYGSGGPCSPTLSWAIPHQCPAGVLPPTKVSNGLSAKFVFEFAQGLVCHEPLTVTPAQVKVISIGSTDTCHLHCETQLFTPGNDPLFLFVLVKGHWTLVVADKQDSALFLRQYDGLARTSLASLSPLVELLKHAWGLTSVSCVSSWVLPQLHNHTCGTLAVAHFAYHLGLITFAQVFEFEHLRDSLAVCSGLCH